MLEILKKKFLSRQTRSSNRSNTKIQEEKASWNLGQELSLNRSVELPTDLRAWVVCSHRETTKVIRLAFLQFHWSWSGHSEKKSEFTIFWSLFTIFTKKYQKYYVFSDTSERGKFKFRSIWRSPGNNKNSSKLWLFDPFISLNESEAGERTGFISVVWSNDRHWVKAFAAPTTHTVWSLHSFLWNRTGFLLIIIIIFLRLNL